jgi:hypothetical protein
VFYKGNIAIAMKEKDARCKTKHSKKLLIDFTTGTLQRLWTSSMMMVVLMPARLL